MNHPSDDTDLLLFAILSPLIVLIWVAVQIREAFRKEGECP